jgi:hypothetical protein
MEIEMPTTIYDASQITKRRMNKVQSADFTNRIQNSSNPSSGYATRLGIYDQSIINTVKVGTMKEFRKQDGGCLAVSNGCPCNPLPEDGSVCCRTN